MIARRYLRLGRRYWLRLWRVGGRWRYLPGTAVLADWEVELLRKNPQRASGGWLIAW